MAYCHNQSEIPPSCSDGVVVVSAAEYLERNPFSLDVASAQQIGVAVMFVWAVAFVFRSVRKFLNGWETTHNDQE